MTTLTEAQLAKLRRALGVYGASFTDEQLQDYADDAYEVDPLKWFEGTVAEGYYNLVTGSVERVNFRQGETSEDESVIFGRLWKLYERWTGLAGVSVVLPPVNIGTIRLHYMDLPEDMDNA